MAVDCHNRDFPTYRALEYTNPNFIGWPNARRSPCHIRISFWQFRQIYCCHCLLLMAIFGEYYKSALPMMERVAEFDAG
jgi:hypothetical protein